MSDIKKAGEMLQNAKFTLQGKTGTASKRAELATNYITDTQMLLENMKEKTCTLTWREDGTALADCSNCGEGQLYNDYNYCPNCGARNINPEDEPIIPPAIQRCPNCDEPYDPKPGVFMVKCLNCGADMWENPSDHPDDEVDIPPEAAQIGMMHPVEDDREPPAPDREDFDSSVASLMEKTHLPDETVSLEPFVEKDVIGLIPPRAKKRDYQYIPAEDLYEDSEIVELRRKAPAEESKVPSDEFFDDAKRHEMELMGGAPEHLLDRAVPSIRKMLREAEEPVKCCKCSRKMDDPEGWVEGINNHMWCPDCQPAEKEVCDVCHSEMVPETVEITEWSCPSCESEEGES